MIPLILASASPRRRQLLQRLGVPFEIVPSDIPECQETGESAADFAMRVAREKAAEVARHHPDAIVLGADTIVVKDNIVFGKPLDRNDARRMLEALSNSTHEVLTAVALIVPGERIQQSLTATRVCFRDLAAEEIETYLDSDEPYDKAGAYAIQGKAAKFVIAVDGSYSNVVGLPLAAIATLLRPHFTLAPATDTEPA